MQLIYIVTIPGLIMTGTKTELVMECFNSVQLD